MPLPRHSLACVACALPRKKIRGPEEAAHDAPSAGFQPIQRWEHDGKLDSYLHILFCNGEYDSLLESFFHEL